MRCLSCDSRMSEVDLARQNPITNEFEDLCGVCLRVIRDLSQPYSMRYDDDEGCLGSDLWLEAILHGDVCSFEHEFKNKT